MSSSLHILFRVPGTGLFANGIKDGQLALFAGHILVPCCEDQERSHQVVEWIDVVRPELPEVDGLRARNLVQSQRKLIFDDGRNVLTPTPEYSTSVETNSGLTSEAAIALGA